jgi:protein-S-isoprenylcysteine O-methyltransferase Ste14
MSTKKHANHPHLTGEHKFGDRIQLALLILFLGVWITDSFVFQYSTFLRDVVPDYARIGVATVVLIPGWILARRGMKAVFGTLRAEPSVIDSGVFRVVRHPIYTGAILFYMGASLVTLSIASAFFLLPIIGFYIWIARYEERILTEQFGQDYLNYQKKTGMLFPKLRSH